MGTIILIIIVLLVGIYIGFMIGFSRTLREAVGKLPGSRFSVVGRIGIVLGSGALLVALGSWIYNLHFTHMAVRTSGTVIALQQQTDKDSGGISYAPTFRFQDAAGVQHTVDSGFFQSPSEFQVGDTVTVLYLSKDPQTARIDSLWQVWGLPILALIMGCLTMLISIILIVIPKIAGRFRGQVAGTPSA